MTAKECIKGRRSIRKFKDTSIDHQVLEDIIETASYAPSWKHTQIVRYIAVEGALKDKIGSECTSMFPNNGTIIQNAPMLIAVTVIKNRCGYEMQAWLLRLFVWLPMSRGSVPLLWESLTEMPFPLCCRSLMTGNWLP